MTVSTEISSNEYTGNGVTTDFDYKFRIFKANQLSVITSDADGDNVVTLRLGTDYTVTGVNKSAGGKVILTKPLANGHKISIARDIPITQETSFRNQSKFFAETHEDAFDYLTMLMQRIWGSLGSLYLKRPNILANWFDAKGYRIANLGKPKRDSDAVDFGTMKDAITVKDKRSLRVNDKDLPALPDTDNRANKLLSFDENGNPVVIVPESGSAADVLTELGGSSGLSLIGGCESIAELRDISGVNYGDQVFLKSYHASKNKGGDIFRWDANSVDADDGGCTIKPDGVVAGRWVRVEHDRYTPEMYGADGTKENDPDAIERLLLNQKRVLFTGVYYYDREFVTNGHDVEGGTTGEYWGNGSVSKIIFFGGFNSPQAVRNEVTKSSYHNMTFEPESWDPDTGYTGTGLRIGRAIDAECCNWFKFKKFGMDLWSSITEELVHYPYGSQFRNCKWEHNGWAGIRLTNGCNSIQIYGGSSCFNGATAYGVAPVDNSSGWDGILVGKVEEVGIPPMSNDFDLQGNIIEGIDCSYNARYGLNAYYVNQSIFNIGYAEDNKGDVDILISDVVACDVNVLVAQKGARIEVPEKGFGVVRSCANYPNRIIINGQFYGSGSKDSFGRYIDYQSGKFKTRVESVGAIGSSGIRSWHENDGSFETYTSGGLALIRANYGPIVPPPSEKMLGTIWRDTSVGPNSVWMCIKGSSDEYIWSQLN